jgi:hypothetical protein
MPTLEVATPAHRGDDAGRQRNATLGSSHLSDTAKNPALQSPSPAVQVAKAVLVREPAVIDARHLFRRASRVEVRISVFGGCSPVRRSRLFHLDHRDPDRLAEFATELEARFCK